MAFHLNHGILVPLVVGLEHALRLGAVERGELHGGGSNLFLVLLQETNEISFSAIGKGNTGYSDISFSDAVSKIIVTLILIPN